MRIHLAVKRIVFEKHLGEMVLRAMVAFPFRIATLLVILAFGLGGAAVAASLQPDDSRASARRYDLADQLAEVRRHVNDDCSHADEMFNYFVKDREDDPAVIDTEIYIVRNSTTTSCVIDNVDGLRGAVNISRYHGRRLSRKLTRKIGDALIVVLQNKKLRAQNWWIWVHAADALKTLGPSYRRDVVTFYHQRLRELVTDYPATEATKWEAMELSWRILDEDRDPSKDLLALALKKFDLIEFSKSSPGAASNRAIAERNRAHREQLEQILRKGK